MVQTDSTNEAALEQVILRPTLHHFGIATTRVEEMADWYFTVLGMEVSLASENPVKSRYVTNDGANHRGGFFHPPFIEEDPDKMKHARIQHLAFEYPTLDDLVTTWERLDGLGIKSVKCTNHGPSFSFYYKDPDNNSVELLADSYGDWELSLKHIREDPQMETNPPGMQVDPAKIREALQAGASLEEVRTRSMEGEFLPAVQADALASF